MSGKFNCSENNQSFLPSSQCAKAAFEFTPNPQKSFTRAMGPPRGLAMGENSGGQMSPST